ncbi:DUF2971 domain-containing protein [soil metagenome]
MFQPHPIFIQPENDAIKVWRYMDFTKFVSLIDSRQLYFTRADKFEDPFEGSFPKMNIQDRQSFFNRPEFQGDENYGLLNLERFHKKMAEYIAINCWHMNEHESAAMWKLYLKSDEGIAIQSTYSRLRQSFIDNKTIYLGTVKYIDYETELIINSTNSFSPFVHKRKSFEHEKEVRALIEILPEGDTINLNQTTIEYGIKIEVALETLIDKIYVAPSAPNWLADLVKAVVNKYEHNFEVVHSALNGRPMF